MADVMAPGEPAQRLVQAVREGNGADVQVLVESNPALAETRDVSGVSVVLLALYHGHKSIADWLASRRTNLDIFEASAVGDLARVAALVDAGPDLVNQFSPDGFTALALASFLGHLPIVQLLLSRGANPNLSAHAGGYTALTGAVTAQQRDIVRELVKAGADVNYRYGPGFSPLHAAAGQGSVEIARILLKAGADPGARTDAGQTPADIAREKGFAEVVALFEGRS